MIGLKRRPHKAEGEKEYREADKSVVHAKEDWTDVQCVETETYLNKIQQQ